MAEEYTPKPRTVVAELKGDNYIVHDPAIGLTFTMDSKSFTDSYETTGKPAAIPEPLTPDAPADDVVIDLADHPAHLADLPADG